MVNDIITDHLENFLSAVQSRRSESLAAPVERGHHSTSWCNLTNKAFRAGGRLASEDLIADHRPERWNGLISEMIDQVQVYGCTTAQFSLTPTMTSDTATQRFAGPNAGVANDLLRKEYRPGFEVKQVVEG